MASTTAPKKLPVAVEKPTPYTFDLGLLLTTDPNPLTIDDSNLEASLAAIARDGAQSLINQLLTTCPATSTKTDGVLLSLPPSHTALPREKPLPAPKPPTKWEQFAKRKGIKPKTKEQRKNLVFNEASGEWEKKWGCKWPSVFPLKLTVFFFYSVCQTQGFFAQEDRHMLRLYQLQRC